MSKIIFTELATKPSPPSVGQVELYVKTDEIVYIQGSDGVEIPLGSSASITALTGDVTATGPGSAVATVAFVGGESASNVASATAAYLAATSANTANTLVLRDSSGNFSAGTITANLTGTATNATTAVNFSGSLLGDITGTQSVTVVSAIQGTAVSGTTGSGNVVFSNAPTLTGLLSGSSASFSSTISASNLSGSNTGDVTVNNSNSINLAFSSGQSGLQANLNLSSSGPDAGYIPVVTEIKTDGLLAEVLSSTPVQIGTTNNAGSAASTVRSDHVHAHGNQTVGTLHAIATDSVNGFMSAADKTKLDAFSGTAGTNAQILISDGTSYNPETVSGDITITNAGVVTIPSNTVTNTKLAQMPANTLKGNNTGSTANATDLTVSQVTAMLGDIVSIGAIDSQTPQSNGLDIVTNVLYAQSASISVPGMVNNTTQSFSGNKTFTGTVAITAASTAALAIDSTSFVFDSVNNALGIGLQPSTAVMIDGLNTTGTSKLVQMTGYGVGSTTGYRGRFARGTSGSPSAVQSGDILSAISGRGYGSSQFAAASTGVLNIVAGETFTNTSNLTYLQFNATPTGSVTSTEAMRVASTGVTLGPQSASTAIHQINGGENLTTKTITASTYTVDTTTTDNIIYTDSTSNAITITLPTATNGRVLFIQDKTGQATTNHITITPPGSVTINGVNASVMLGVNYGGWAFTSDGTNWTAYRLAQLPSVQALSGTLIDWSTVGIAGGLFTKTLSAATTFTFANATPGQTIVIRLTNTASDWTVTWPTVRWAVAIAPAMSPGAVSDVYTILYDGSAYYGSYVQNMS